MAMYELKMNKELCALPASPTIRLLLGKLKCDWEKESIDIPASVAAIRAYAKEKPEILSDERLRIIQFLNDVSGVRLLLSDSWWFENNYRILKYICVSTALESANYRRYAKEGVSPTAMDMPQSLVYLRMFIAMWKSTHEHEYREEYGKLLKDKDVLALIDCYTH